jgi:aerobic carbon-monoxide dehydrogenase large subunit
VTRLEDPDLLSGRARFVADLPAEGALHAVFVRSAEAHARIVAVDVDSAAECDGVVAVDTAATLGLGPFVHFPDLPAAMARHPLARDTVRHVGEAVAVVLAEDEAAAVDGAEQVVVELDGLAPLVDLEAALRAPPLYPGADSNLVQALDDMAGGDDPTAGAALVVELAVTNPKLASAPIETDGILARPDGEDGLDVWCTSQGVHSLRDELADHLGLDRHRVRLRSPAVGGAFGGRGMLAVEFAVVARLALRHQRPVRWIQSRTENLTGMPQGRGHEAVVRLGVDGDGRFTGLDVDVLADSGATAHMAGPLLVSVRRQATGLYRIGRLRWRGRAVLTDTTPVGAYRGAGQPEANHARERVIDVAARRLGVDPVELRRANLAAASEFPLTTAGGVTYDAADPVAALDLALERADLGRWRTEQARRRAEGDVAEIGVGVACYAQTTGRGRPTDAAHVRVGDDGRVLVRCGSASHGQGHRTTMAGLVARELGVDPADVDLVDADTDAVPDALTTGGSRASQVLASVVVGACGDVLAAARPLAAARLEAAEADLVVVAAAGDRPAGLAVAGVPSRRVGWAELAAESENGCLEAIRADAALGEAHPYGTHVTVVEVDLETGGVQVLAHVAVDDCGTVLQPVLVEGQQHGGSAAGIGPALWEAIAYDEEANPLSANFATYLLPTATELPSITTATLGTASERNVLGTRGIGENGCNGATAAVHNAVMDALAPYGVEHVDLPLTPERLWAAVSRSRRPGG